MQSYIEFKNVNKVYHMGTQEISANRDVCFNINEGEFCVIVGASGAGKTTVLNLLGGMDKPNSGSIILDNDDIASFNEKKLTNYRRYAVGFVFQFYNLMPHLTAFENIEISSEISRNPLDTKEALRLVGLEERMNNFPAQLSGGEQQRVSIARAIAKNPKILLCDEPTGALDFETGRQILKLLQDMCKKTGKTVIVVTHNQAITQMANRVIYFKNGSVLKTEINESPVDVSLINW